MTVPIVPIVPRRLVWLTYGVFRGTVPLAGHRPPIVPSPWGTVKGTIKSEAIVPTFQLTYADSAMRRSTGDGGDGRKRRFTRENLPDPKLGKVLHLYLQDSCKPLSGTPPHPCLGVDLVTRDAEPGDPAQGGKLLLRFASSSCSTVKVCPRANSRISSRWVLRKSSLVIRLPICS